MLKAPDLGLTFIILANNYNLKASQYAEEAARQNAKAQRLAHAPTISGR